MADPVVLVEPDPFTGTGASVAEYIPSYRTDSTATLAAKRELAASFDNMDLSEIQAVSRPLNGIAVKPNTHAYVQVIQSDQKVVKVFNQLGMPLDYAMSGQPDPKDETPSRLSREGFGLPKDSSGAVIPQGTIANIASALGDRTDYNDRAATRAGSGGMGVDEHGNPLAQAWTDWILQSVRESRAEKTQLVETFGDSYLYAFGEKPRILAFQGLLMNTADYNWRGVFWENWDKFFRASRLIEMDARIYISWEDIIVEGYPIQAQAQESASSPNAMSFSFNMYVTNYFNISMANRTAMMASGKLYSLGMSRSQSLGEVRNVATILDNRTSTFDKFMDIGGTALNDKYPHGISPDGWELNEDGSKKRKISNADLFGLRTLRSSLNMISRVATGAHTTTGDQAAGFLNSWLLQIGWDAAKTTMAGAQATIAEWGLSVSEQNAWFGYLGQLTDNIMLSSGVSDEQKWDPTLGQGGSFLDAFRGGSIDRLIQRMSYQIVGLIDLDPNTSRNTIGTVGATGGYKQYGAYPGAAVVTPLTPVEYGASTTSLASLAGTAGTPGDPFGD